ncbi:MAG: F0F1 ATP synthase subunit A, partial [bacterium]
MEVNGPFIYFTIPLFGGIPITQTTVSSLAVMLILVLAGRYLGKDLEKRPGTRQVLAEKLVLFFQDLVEETMGAHNVYWTPYIGALFLSSILGTLIG